MKKRKKSTSPAVEKLSRRERQIMDILLRRREATAQLVQADLPDPPSYDSVRTILRILTEKGAAVRRADGTRYIYAPAVDLDTARQVALTHLVRTFFQGSAGRAALELLKKSDLSLNEAELARLEKKIQKSEKKK